MPYNFVSPGAMAGNAIQQFLLQRDQQQRQAMLDQLAKEAQQAEIASRTRGQDLQERQIKGLEADRERDNARADMETQFRRAGTIAENALPGDAVDQATADLLTTNGFGGQIRRTPGVVQQGPQIGEDNEIPIYGVTQQPDTLQLRGGSKYLSARATEDARAAAAEAAQGARADESEKDREVRLLIAQIAASGRADTTDLRRQLLEAQIAAAKEKNETTAQQKVNARNIAKSRAAETLGLLDKLATFNPDGTATLKPGMANLYGMQNPLARAIPGSETNVAKATRERLLSRAVVDFLDEMKQQSRTGATGFGQFTEKELALVQSAVSKLNSPMIDDATAAEELARMYQSIQRTLQDEAPAGAPAPSGAAPRRRRYDINGNPLP